MNQRKLMTTDIFLLLSASHGVQCISRAIPVVVTSSLFLLVLTKHANWPNANA